MMNPAPKPDDIPQGATYGSQLKKFAEENPNKQAFVFIDRDWNKIVLTRKDVWDLSRKYAAILRRHGIRKGDLVCNTLVNSPERLLTSFGIILLGAVSMHGQVILADGKDLLHNCKIARCKAIIIDSGQAKGALTILNSVQYTDGNTGDVRYDGLPDMTTVIKLTVCSQAVDATIYERSLHCLKEEHEMFEEPEVAEDDNAIVVCTSGTTGFSKQVPFSHRVSLRIGYSLGKGMGIESEKSRYYSNNSLGWIGGFPAPYLVFGATRVLSDHAKGLPEPSGERTLRILNEEDIDCAFLVPGEIDLIVHSINSGHDLNRKLRAIGTGGMPITKRIQNGIGQFTYAINILYGSTEVGIVTLFCLEKGTPFEDYCIGDVSKDVQIKILDKEHNEVPVGNFGEVAIQCDTVCAGYLNEPDRTKKAFTGDGFFLTGDNGYKDPNGMYYVPGRQIDAIHCGAFIHYPNWIESRIAKMPGIEHVSVIGVPNEVSHEDICACIITSGQQMMTEQQVYTHCHSLFMHHDPEMTAMPKYFLFFKSFPRNSNGKLDRKLLRAEACKRLNIELKVLAR